MCVCVCVGLPAFVALMIFQLLSSPMDEVHLNMLPCVCMCVCLCGFASVRCVNDIPAAFSPMDEVHLNMIPCVYVRVCLCMFVCVVVTLHAGICSCICVCLCVTKCHSHKRQCVETH